MINNYLQHLTYNSSNKVNDTLCPWLGQLVSTLTGMDEQIYVNEDIENVP